MHAATPLQRQLTACMQDDAEKMRKASMEQYSDLKQRIFNFTSILVTAGLFVAAFTGGAEAAEAFALGGMMAFVYQLALNGSVDQLALDTPASAVDLGLRGSGKSDAAAAGARKAAAPAGGAGGGFSLKLAAGGLKRYAAVTATLLGAIIATQLWDGAALSLASLSLASLSLAGLSLAGLWRHPRTWVQANVTLPGRLPCRLQCVCLHSVSRSPQRTCITSAGTLRESTAVSHPGSSLAELPVPHSCQPECLAACIAKAAHLCRPAKVCLTDFPVAHAPPHTPQSVHAEPASCPPCQQHALRWIHLWRACRPQRHRRGGAPADHHRDGHAGLRLVQGRRHRRGACTGARQQHRAAQHVCQADVTMPPVVAAGDSKQTRLLRKQVCGSDSI